MNYFEKFLNNTEHLPYVISSYIIVFFLLLIIYISSLRRIKSLEKNFQSLNKK